MIKQLQFTSLAFSLVFASLSENVVQPLHVEQSAVEHPKIIKPDHGENAVRSPAASADVKLSLQDHQPIVYTAEAPRLGSVHGSSVEKNPHRQ